MQQIDLYATHAVVCYDVVLVLLASSALCMLYETGFLYLLARDSKMDTFENTQHEIVY